MRVKKIYGALNIEFEGRKYLNFAILDRKCDECLDGNCNQCDENGKPWREYYQLIRYGGEYLEDEKVTYEKDITEAVRLLVNSLQEYLNEKEELKECIDTER